MDVILEKLTLIDPATAPNRFIRAYASILIGDFLVVSCKVVRRPDGRLYVGLPDRPVTWPCRRCQQTNPLASRYCSSCGALLPIVGGDGLDSPPMPEHFYQSLCHPANRKARAVIEALVLEAYDRATSEAAPPTWEAMIA